MKSKKLEVDESETVRVKQITEHDWCEVDPVLEQEKLHDEWYERERKIHNGG